MKYRVVASRLVSAIGTLIASLVVLGQAAIAGPKDYLQPGEAMPTAAWEAKYYNAVRHLLSRGWRNDVVLRMSDIPPFQSEWVTGVSRTTSGYHAFSVTASKHIWAAHGFAPEEPGTKGYDYRSIHPMLRERSLSESVAARIAALWRRVLSDRRNYGKDPSSYLDTDEFSFHLSFFPREHLAAHMTGWGPKVDQLTDVAGALADYSVGGSEQELMRVVAKAERKLGR